MTLSRNDEKKICRPTSEQLEEADRQRRVRPSAPNPWSIHWITMISAVNKSADRDRTPDQQSVLQPEAGPRAASNHASFSPMK